MQFSSAMRPVTVGQLNQYLKEKLARDDALQSICVEGEISNLTLHTSGHIYFTLKDASAAIRAVLFRGYRTSLKFIPANGMRVLLIGDVALYERNGGVQIYVQRMLQAGAGEISLQYEQLKRRLEAEGLFDAAHKRPIPKFPEKICLVTSPTGAALQDIRNVLHRRYPLARVQLCPTMVQGAEAASDIVRALAVADAMRPDVILLARGGGSIETYMSSTMNRSPERFMPYTRQSSPASGTRPTSLSPILSPTSALPPLRPRPSSLFPINRRCSSTWYRRKTDWNPPWRSA